MPSSLQQQRNKNRATQSQATPRWLVFAVAALAMAVIFLGIGITTMVVMLEREQNDAAAAAQPTAVGAVETGPPGEIIIITPSPTPTEQPLLPTPTIIPTDVPATPAIEVDRDERNDIMPANPQPSPVITASVLPEGAVIAPRVSSPFVIDGDLDGWVNIPTTVSAYTVFNQTWWDQSNDLDAFWRLSWDSINLYVGVVVVDNLHVQTQQALTAYRGDSLELQIDTDISGDPDTLINTDDFQLVLSPGDFGTISPSAFRFRGTVENRMEGYPGHSIAVSAAKTDNGYVLEAAIPWDDISLRPLDDLVIGLSLNANDNDIVDAAVQEMMKSHVTTRTFDKPSTWGTLVLTNN